MLAVSIKLDWKRAKAKLQGLRRALRTGEGLAPAFRTIGTVALEHIRFDFKENAKIGGDWEEVSWVTIVLGNRRRGGGKIRNETDLERRIARAVPLRDTGVLMNSLTPASPGNVFTLAPLSVIVGTTVHHAGLHQTGGRQVLKVGPEELARFDENVSQTVSGRRVPKELKSGKRHRWKSKSNPKGKESPWNPLYFILHNALQKLSGKSLRVPQRKIVQQPTPARMMRYAGILVKHVKTLFDKGTGR
ncbi:MAG TPA: hypothetical protein VM487_18520 [Phycisphaerae bacterium]|nr:hypothetical protein [Phycisphaerae bacterium]